MDEPESVKLTTGQILSCLETSTPAELLEVLEEFFGRRTTQAVTWDDWGKGAEFTQHLTHNLLPQLILADSLRDGRCQIWSYHTLAADRRQFTAIHTAVKLKQSSYERTLEFDVSR